VLARTETYPQLVRDVIGQSGLLAPIPTSARVIDLGAGTGNLTQVLAEPESRRTTVAVERNPFMLRVLRTKCWSRLRPDTAEPGVLVVPQDCQNLSGIPDAYFDYALMNNVLYSLEDPIAALQETCRVLRPGGELRLTGPTQSTRVDRLLRTLKKEIQAKDVWKEVEDDFARVQHTNETFLKHMPGFRWSVSEIHQMLAKAGFEVRKTVAVYAGQGVLHSAVRRV
jgi:ubiquinone/menaquinone biosynthesis C-methylase UbiE